MHLIVVVVVVGWRNGSHQQHLNNIRNNPLIFHKLLYTNKRGYNNDYPIKKCEVVVQQEESLLV